MKKGMKRTGPGLCQQDDPNNQCLHCGEQLTQDTTSPWLHCQSCSHAYLPDDLTKAHRQRQAARDRQDILDTLREQNRRRNDKPGSSNSSPGKDDKLRSRSLRDVTWDDNETTLVSWVKNESKSEFLAVRGLPDEIPSEAVMLAIEMELGESGVTT